MIRRDAEPRSLEEASKLPCSAPCVFAFAADAGETFGPQRAVGLSGIDAQGLEALRWAKISLNSSFVEDEITLIRKCFALLKTTLQN